MRGKEVEVECEINRNWVLGREGVAHQVEVRTNGKSIEFVTSFKYLCSCFGKDAGL